jgi:predicted nucleic acid-binding protein
MTMYLLDTDHITLIDRGGKEAEAIRTRLSGVPQEDEEFQRLCVRRVRIGTMDLKIAAIALANDATLLSRNLPDFAKVPGLRVEDWSA